MSQFENLLRKTSQRVESLPWALLISKSGVAPTFGHNPFSRLLNGAGNRLCLGSKRPLLPQSPWEKVGIFAPPYLLCVLL